MSPGKVAVPFFIPNLFNKNEISPDFIYFLYFDTKFKVRGNNNG